MSYNGTVRCRFCYEKGHNRASCEALKKHMDDRLQRNPDDWRAKEYYAKKRKGGGNRKCSYCEEPGHTRRTCKELSYAKMIAMQKCSQWRQDFVKKLKKHGIGIGALVKYYTYDNGDEVGMVTDICWSGLDHRVDHGASAIISRALMVKPMHSLSGRGNRGVALPKEFEEAYLRESRRATRPTEVLGAINAAAIEKQLPVGFMSGEDCIEPIFADSEASQDRTKCWNVADWCARQGFYKDEFRATGENV